jgi:predicted RNA-binding Zn ribbon-like protein
MEFYRLEGFDVAGDGSQFFFVGNDPCLDFVNTTAVLDGAVTDLLADFGDLVDWLVAAGMVDADAGNSLKKRNGARDAESALGDARAFRAELRRAAEAVAAGKSVPDSTVRAVNDQLRRAPRYTQLRGRGRKFEKAPLAAAPDPARLLVPVAEAAATLLAERDLSRVKRCGNPACILFFYDGSKNQGRRWCTMAVCGNRMKQAAHQQRQREQG